jgi:hypothetical protein
MIVDDQRARRITIVKQATEIVCGIPNLDSTGNIVWILPRPVVNDGKGLLKHSCGFVWPLEIVETRAEDGRMEHEDTERGRVSGHLAGEGGSSEAVSCLLNLAARRRPDRQTAAADWQGGRRPVRRVRHLKAASARSRERAKSNEQPNPDVQDSHARVQRLP